MNNNKYDPIAYHLLKIDNWIIFGHLTFLNSISNEKKRLNKVHLLFKNTSKRFTGKRDLHSLGWFLRSGGNNIDRNFHFHFALTNHNLQNKNIQTICKFLSKQWEKIDGGLSIIEPFNNSLKQQAIFYLTKNKEYDFPINEYIEPTCIYSLSKSLASC